MERTRLHFLFLNLGHFLDHFFMLVFATVAALVLTRDWGLSYAELIPYATPGFVAFAVFALPAGWLADKWSREGMMVVFFLGIGLVSALTALANSPVQIGVGLFFVGIFAAIYHPVGLALVVAGRTRTGIPLAVNGIFGNLGVAGAAFITAFMIDTAGWRAAFLCPGLVSLVIGLAYWGMIARHKASRTATPKRGSAPAVHQSPAIHPSLLVRVFSIIFFSTMLGGLIFQSTTFSLPKVFGESLDELAISATAVGGYAFLVFALAAVGQLIVGYLVDRHSLRLVFAVVAALQAIFFAIMPGLTDWAAIVTAAIFMLAVFGQIPINDVLIGRITKSQWRSRVFALRYLATFSVTAVSVPFIAWVHGSWGFDRLFLILALAAAAIFLAVMFLPKAGLRPGLAAE